MSRDEQLEAFGGELDRLVDRFRDEFDIPYTSVIGILHLKAHMLCEELSKSEDSE